MRSQWILERITFGLLVLVLLAVGGSVLSVSSETGAAAAEPSGPWVVAAAGGGGYLLNTETGELWRLRDDVKLPVRELNR